MRLLEDGDHHAAAVPLQRVAELEPDKTSVREALGRALFGSQRFREAEAEFAAVVARAPTNHYALFCLGRSLQLQGRHREAGRPFALACSLRRTARTTGNTGTDRAAGQAEAALKSLAMLSRHFSPGRKAD